MAVCPALAHPAVIPRRRLLSAVRRYGKIRDITIKGQFGFVEFDRRDDAVSVRRDPHTRARSPAAWTAACVRALPCAS